ncbi:hypothetical protein HETIRDRAFT_455623 [Heterobasidion irregulare TC 32-1]|uniref:Uncharacterized protein n=1 Tax=Heterobasidion irregulare (strain TC 32-1) TaxID=747525 RepID=W4JR49_HETIT|nr:uncharacterized protein HETIRDRAFT_455623 [Heterobasidion irregulare TC 32-1]ETW76018.1 hypothetical protein HETIRDRAFT_455623 [Heterobasidion irregulare TC 32-1]
MTQRRDRHGILYINPCPAAVALHPLNHHSLFAASPEAGFIVNAPVNGVWPTHDPPASKREMTQDNNAIRWLSSLSVRTARVAQRRHSSRIGSLRRPCKSLSACRVHRAPPSQGKMKAGGEGAGTFGAA